MGKWGHQDHFKPVYYFLWKEITRGKILTSKNKLTKHLQAKNTYKQKQTKQKQTSKAKTN